ncbi:MAG: recombinase family protein [Deltaproteobacteria bacterium]|nr:recombinase family protein [Deltaproteobacteria bacterium]
MSAAIGYMRISSKSQESATQRAAIERAAAARGDTITSWYDEKMSGKTLARPELQRLRADVRAGIVSKIYVYRLDRLTRSGIRDTFEVIEELHAHGCQLVSIGDGFDLAGPAAEIILAVLAWSAKAERQVIGERVAAARMRLEAEGRPWGRPSRLRDGERVQLMKLREQGMSLRQIAVTMRVPKTTVIRALAAVRNTTPNSGRKTDASMPPDPGAVPSSTCGPS